MTVRIRAALAAAAATVALAGLVTGCKSSHSGTPGTVVARDAQEHCHNTGTSTFPHWSCSDHYQLTTQPRHSHSHHAFAVSSTVYRRCTGGASYPACAGR